jgi:hypothetical protein
MELNDVEKGMMARQVIRAIRNDGFPKIEVHIFIDYARSEYPSITNTGIVNLWRTYRNDPKM